MFKQINFRIREITDKNLGEKTFIEKPIELNISKVTRICKGRYLYIER